MFNKRFVVTNLNSFKCEPVILKGETYKDGEDVKISCEDLFSYYGKVIGFVENGKMIITDKFVFETKKQAQKFINDHVDEWKEFCSDAKSKIPNNFWQVVCENGVFVPKIIENIYVYPLPHEQKMIAYCGSIEIATFKDGQWSCSKCYTCYETCKLNIKNYSVPENLMASFIKLK